MPDKVPEVALIVIASTGLILFLGGIVIFVLFAQQKRRYRHRQQLVELKNNYDREILKTESEIQEETMKNISQELHDNIGTMISLAMVNLDLHQMSNQHENRPHIAEAKTILDNAITDLKDLAKSLNGSQVNTAGLLNAIQKEVNRLNKTNYYQVEFLANSAILELNSQKQLILFRIFQECINNIIRHAQSKKIRITITQEDHILQLEIRDYGIGFDTTRLPATYEKNGGSGIQNIKNRLQLINGEMHIDSALNRGTGIVIKIPATDAV